MRIGLPVSGASSHTWARAELSAGLFSATRRRPSLSAKWLRKIGLDQLEVLPVQFATLAESEVMKSSSAHQRSRGICGSAMSSEWLRSTVIRVRPSVTGKRLAEQAPWARTMGDGSSRSIFSMPASMAGETFFASHASRMAHKRTVGYLESRHRKVNGSSRPPTP